MSDIETRETVSYSATYRMEDSLFSIMRFFSRDLWKNRWLIWITFKRDFVSSYRKTSLGLFWAVVLPLIPLSVYLLLAYVRVLKTSENIPYVVYIVCGMMVWTFITGCLRVPIEAVAREGSILTKARYSLISLILSHFGRVFFDTLVRLVFVFIIFILFDVSVGGNIIFFPLLFIPPLLFAIGLGMILAIINIMMGDIMNLVSLGITYGLFFSSVIFPMPETGIVGELNRFNPFNTFVVAVREFMVLGEISHPDNLLITSLISLIIFLFSLRVIYIMEPRIKTYL